MRLLNLNPLMWISISVFLLVAQQANALDIAAETVVVGDIKIVRPDRSVIVLSEDEILKLPLRTLTTHTAWTTGQHEFKGVYVFDILIRAGINPETASENDTLCTTSLSGYTITVPLKEVMKYDALIATYMDGERLTVRNKGPWRIVYPRDNFKELQDLLFDARWTWHLKELQVERK